jgi:hypothetical protein
MSNWLSEIQQQKALNQHYNYVLDNYAPPGTMYFYSTQYLKHPTMNYKITGISPPEMIFETWEYPTPVKLKLDEEW